MFQARSTASAKARRWKFKGLRKKVSAPGGWRLIAQALCRMPQPSQGSTSLLMDFYFYPKKDGGGVTLFIARGGLCFRAVKRFCRNPR